MKNVIITGATGMVGKGVLLECLDHESIGKVLVIGRNPVDVQHPKLIEIQHFDFGDFSSIMNQLIGFDACFFCLGISAAGLKEDQYQRITYDYTMELAKTLFSINAGMTFNYISGQGTDSSEKGRMMWARIKGKTENDLMQLGFDQTYMFRPGMIIPLRGISSRTRMYQFMYDNFMWGVKGIKRIWPNSVVDTSQIGLAMIHSMIYGYSKKILTPKDIILLSKQDESHP